MNDNNKIYIKKLATVLSQRRTLPSANFCGASYGPPNLFLQKLYCLFCKYSMKNSDSTQLKIVLKGALKAYLSLLHKILSHIYTKLRKRPPKLRSSRFREEIVHTVAAV